MIDWKLVNPMNYATEDRVGRYPILATIIQVLGTAVGAFCIGIGISHEDGARFWIGVGIILSCYTTAEVLSLLHSIAVDTRVMRWKAEGKHRDATTGVEPREEKLIGVTEVRADEDRVGWFEAK